MPTRNVPVVCSLTDSELRNRRENVLLEIKKSILQTKELKNGYLFSFPKENNWFQKIAEMIALEHVCCPFINFKLSIGANYDEIRLSMTGQKGTKQFISTLFL